jgi:hypothetical protein
MESCNVLGIFLEKYRKLPFSMEDHGSKTDEGVPVIDLSIVKSEKTPF